MFFIFFKYSCTNMFHRRSHHTFYQLIQTQILLFCRFPKQYLAQPKRKLYCVSCARRPCNSPPLNGVVPTGSTGFLLRNGHWRAITCRFRWHHDDETTGGVGLQQWGYLTHWGRDKMETTFSSAFSWMKMFGFRLKFHWNLFLRTQLTIFQHWFR